LVVGLGWYYSNQDYNIYIAGTIFAIALFIVTYFVNIHADAAEAFSITFLIE
jgi:hypothetical protein